MRSSRFICGQCHTPLNESPHVPVSGRTPCPTCGSKMRVVEGEIDELAKTRASLHAASHPSQRARTTPTQELTEW